MDNDIMLFHNNIITINYIKFLEKKTRFSAVGSVWLIKKQITKRLKRKLRQVIFWLIFKSIYNIDLLTSSVSLKVR